MHFDPGQLGKNIAGVHTAGGVFQSWYFLFIYTKHFLWSSAKEQGKAFQLSPAPGLPEAAGAVGGSTVSCGVAQHLQNSSVHVLQADASDLDFNDQDKNKDYPPG